MEVSEEATTTVKANSCCHPRAVDHRGILCLAAPSPGRKVCSDSGSN